jgi:hypothetical protein
VELVIQAHLLVVLEVLDMVQAEMLVHIMQGLVLLLQQDPLEFQRLVDQVE